MDKEKELPKRKDIRLKNFDYSSPGAYFITICTENSRKNPQEWEHNSIDEYLDAMMAWINDFSKCKY